MSKKYIISESQFRILLEDDNSSVIANLKRLADSEDVENIELALEMGEGLKDLFDVEQYLMDLYQPIFRFLKNKGNPVLGGTLSGRIAHIRNLKKLDFESLGLKELPNIFDRFPNLEILNVKKNQLKELPNTMGNLHKLKKLFIGINQLTELPKFIITLPNLEYLSLFDNNITELPNDISNLVKLRELVLPEVSKIEKERIKAFLPNTFVR